MRGKLSFIRFGFPYREDHPRGCGENDEIITAAQPKIGSPPRMRGKL